MRTVEKVVAAELGSDGAGVKLYRSVGRSTLPDVNPILLLDEFCSDDKDDYIGGFPDHPHRGFETVTVMLQGKMRHSDSSDNSGVIESGGVQWMTAGKGVIHSEMPEQEEGKMHGFQLWFNLPAEHKMIAPRYQDIPASDIPVVEIPEGSVRVIAGEFKGQPGPVTDIVTKPTLLDVSVHSVNALSVPLQGVALVYVYENTLSVGERTIAAREVAVLSEGESVELRGDGRALVIAAKPLNESISRYGPFVMNTREQIMAAFDDYQAGRLV